MIIKRKYYSDKKDKEENKKSSGSSKAGKVVKGVGAGLATTVGLDLLNMYKTGRELGKLVDQADDNYESNKEKEIARHKKMEYKIENQNSRLRDQINERANLIKDGDKKMNYIRKNSNRLARAYENQSLKEFNLHRSNLTNLSNINKKEISEIGDKVIDKAAKRRIGEVLLGLGAGLGTYHYLRKKKKKKNKKDDN